MQIQIFYMIMFINYSFNLINFRNNLQTITISWQDYEIIFIPQQHTTFQHITMYNIQSLNTAFMRPIFSPRSQMSRYMNDIQKNKTSLIINIDKQTLALFKNEFQNNDNKIDKLTFVATGLKILKSWQKQMQYRQSRIVAYLLSLFQQIQNKFDGLYISWEQFNNLIIEKALNLKSLQSHDTQAISQLKSVNWTRGKSKLITPLQKIVCLNKEKKVAFLCQESNKIQFLNMANNQHNFKPLIIDRQDLMVEKTLVKRVKNQATRAIVKENYKKGVIVSGYSVTFLDMIYVSNDKYQMLITSSSDGIIRGWDVRGTTPTLAKQPQNQQQKMLHQFPVQIHSMAWDDINDVLYCSAKDSKIYIWIVKTDSQKQLTDPDGHQAMISSMIMMPKLQFLATGDYEGKLILWDTISMNKKYKYEQHTRSIVSMTFHQTLILLFTASFDHSICVWNPYIPSLIYKISCNLNVIQVHIIKGTNYLAALDTGSNLKIRQINKFNLISTFVVDRPQDNQALKAEQGRNQQFVKIEPTCMTVSEDPARFFFGGHSIKCMQFDENQALAASEYYPTFLKYHAQKMKMYVVIKNNILIWDMLTGQLYDILQSQSDQQITAIDLIQNSSRFVVADAQGSIYIRKLQNGIKISRIYKHKNKISGSHLISKRGGIWNQSIIICCFQDGEIVVFGKDQTFDYSLLRSFNIRKYFMNAFILSIEYEQKRNILIIATSSGDLICYDVDKNRILNHIQAKGLQSIKFIIKSQIPSVLTFGKSGEVLGLYLPPHSKKFKISCNLSIASTQSHQQKICCSAMCKSNNQSFVGYENGVIAKFLLSQHYINNQQLSVKNIIKISPEWQSKFSEVPKDMILILNQTVLAIIFHMKNITFIEAKTGQVLSILPTFAFSSHPNFYQSPLCYYNSLLENQRQKIKQLSIDKQKNNEGQALIKDKDKEKRNKHQIYITQQNKYYPISLNGTVQNIDIKIFHDPYFLCGQYSKIISGLGRQKQTKQTKQQKQIKQLKNVTQNNTNTVKQNKQTPVIWNKNWKIFPQFKQIVNKNITQLLKIWKDAQQLNSKPAKRIIKNASLSTTKNLQRAVQVQRKWEQLTNQIQDNQASKNKLFSLSSFKLPLNLDKRNISQNSKNQSSNKNVQTESKNITKHKSLYKNQSSPYIRLGLALQRINERDQKAAKFIQIGEKNELIKNLKLPRINTKVD